ncbi:MAG: cobalamin-dependent protein, partial [Elusimicrobia bacterium]|nr:cobalamin-dependent protein [Elusimicrobiota bacterium]
MHPGTSLRAALVGLPFDPTYRYLLAPACLKAYSDAQPAVAARWRIRLHHGRAGDDPRRLARAVLEGRPDLVGVSVYVWNAEAVGRLLAELRRLAPSLTLVVGGPEAGPQAESLLAAWPALDLVCTGEGEAAFAELLERLADGSGAAGCPGFVRRTAGGAAREAARPLIADLSTVPSPLLAGLLPVESGDSLVLETTRGCPFRCKFCDWQNGQAFRHFPLERAFAEARWLLARLSSFFVFYADADPFMDAERGTALARGLAAASVGRTCRFNFQTYLPRVPDAAFDAMNSERFSLAAGVESVNKAALKAMSRFFHEGKMSEAVSRMRKRAPRARLQIQLIYGVPDDDLAGFRASLSWALHKGPDTLFLPHALALPGAEFGRRPADFGIVCEPAPPHRVLRAGSWSPEDLEAACGLALRVSTLRSERFCGPVLDRLARAAGGDPLPVWEEAARRLDGEAVGFGLGRDIARASALERAFCRFSWDPDQAYEGRMAVLAVLERHARDTLEAAGRMDSLPALERMLAAQRA